jgi:hypothetical protein
VPRVSVTVPDDLFEFLRKAARLLARVDPRASVSSLIGSLIEQRRAHLEALASVDHIAPRAHTPRDEAKARFKAEPHVSFQRHVREVYADMENRPVLASLRGSTVRPITYSEAASIILKYEWLHTMAAGTRYSYGLHSSDGELLGAVCFSLNASPQARWICKPRATIKRTICLARGACVPHAPKNAASFLVRHACRLMHEQHGYKVFFAYSDPEAGERGIIYRAVGWKCLGAGLGRTTRYHTSAVAPDGKVTQSYNVYKLAARLGWTPAKGTKRGYLESLGYTMRRTPDKIKWVWFEDARLAAQCRYPFAPLHGQRI